ncbi:MAG: hypothetical protein KAX18_03080, partial [Candidatus Lokiarchaeota archaeon]|nr:hypothetical protein [Candidatus Lokiarchaeota archaeon]
MDKEEPQNCKKNQKSLDCKDYCPQFDDEILNYTQDNDSLTLTKSEKEKSIKINKLKENIRSFEWDKISDEWSIVHLPRYRAQYETITLDPKQNCSRTNPLYKHRQWLEFIYKNENLKLTDLLIAQICEVTTSTINRWRKKLNISKKVSNRRWIHEGRVNLYMP